MYRKLYLMLNVSSLIYVQKLGLDVFVLEFFYCFVWIGFVIYLYVVFKEKVVLFNFVEFFEIFFIEFEVEDFNVGCKLISVSVFWQYVMILLDVLLENYL